MLLDLWGLLRAATIRKAAGRMRRVWRVKVGSEIHEVAEEDLDEFLSQIVEETKSIKIGRGKRKAPKVVVEGKPPQVVEQKVAKANKKIADIYSVIVKKYLAEVEDEEVLWLMA